MYLALDDREDLPEKVLTEMKLTRKWVLAIVGDKWPLQHRHVLGRAVLDWQRCVGQVLRGRVPVR